MGDKNQRHFLGRKLPSVEGPVLEIGAKEYQQFTQSFRGFYPNEYVGVDLEPGDGVDVVADLSESLGGLEEGKYGLVIACSVLEHVRNPRAMADNLVKLLRPGGAVFISVPWVWRYHAYPDDYQRFSWSGIQVLFPAVKWDQAEFSTTREGELFPAVKDADNNLAVVIEGRKFLPYLMLQMIGWTETKK
jgi:SAM-dependent methyltransferase